MTTATLTAARFGLIDPTGHAYRGLSFGSEKAARQYLDRQPAAFRRMLATARYKVGPIVPAAPCCDPAEPEPCAARTGDAAGTPVVEPRPGRPARVKPADTCRLTLTIRGDDYRVRGIPADAFGATARAFRLIKVGSAETHHVAETVHGPTCDCPDQTFRHEGSDGTGCKHIRALRALGLIR